MRILLVDHDKIFRKGLHLRIEKEKDMKMKGTGTTKNQLVKTLNEWEPDVVLINTEVSDVVDVIKMTAFIKKTREQTKIIYILSSFDRKLIIKGMETGVDGYLPKQFDSSVLIHTIHEVHNENYVISGKIAKTIINYVKLIKPDEKEIINQQLKKIGVHPTKRELDVMFLLYKEKKNKEMAEILQLSESTIRDYVSKSYSKIGKNNRKEVIGFLYKIMGYEGKNAKVNP